MKTSIIFIALILLLGCENKTQEKKEVLFNQELADELKQMNIVDQLAANNAFAPEEFKHLSEKEWEEKKDSIYNTNKNRLEEILNKYNYPGYDLVGKEGEHNYWLIAQHCDHDLEFQKRVLIALKNQVKIGNADGRSYGLLSDRVRINSEQKQLFGTQVKYIKETGQAVPRILEDSLNVNKRRDSLGLEPIEEYLNFMTNLYFEMNKTNLLKRGVTKPKVYDNNQPIDFTE